MEKRAFQFGVLGGILGVAAGAVELSIGTRILPWIGNKESPVVLGLVTMVLSGVALVSIISVRKKSSLSNDRRLAIFLGVLLPAVICFTTVGRLWYLPGPLLLAASILLAYAFWIRPSRENPRPQVSRNLQIQSFIGIVGSLLILVTVGLAFFLSAFGLFQGNVFIGANRYQILVLPMDIVRLANLSADASLMEEFEVSVVMYVYVCLLAGASVAFISSLVGSRIFRITGGLIVLAGLIFFLVAMPGEFTRIGLPARNILDMFGSLGMGWFIPLSGAVFILLADFFKTQPR